MQSSQSVLSFYFDMLFINSIEHIKKSFISNSTLRKKGYSYLQEYDYYMNEYLHEDEGEMPVFTIDIIGRDIFFERLLNIETTSIYENIESEISTNLDDENKAVYLKSIYDDIQVLIKRLWNFDDEEKDKIENKLIEIINNLKDRYSSIIPSHNVFKYITKETDITFFKNKDLKYSFYVDLYEFAYTLYLIDDTEIEERNFIEAFTSPKPQTLQHKIRFSANNYVVAYFLESLKPFFNGFTHMAIEKSEVFLNKQNKPLKSTDIYTSLSRGKNKIENEKNKIDAHILELKHKHLK